MDWVLKQDHGHGLRRGGIGPVVGLGSGKPGQVGEDTVAASFRGQGLGHGK